MVEPYVFCSPEFVLEVPSVGTGTVLEPTTTSNHGSSGWAVSPAALAQFQSDLYSVCTPDLRRRLHRPVLSSSLGAAAVAAGSVRDVALMMMYEGPNTTTTTTGSGGVPAAAPDGVSFVAAKATNALSAEEEASLAQTIKAVGRGPQATAAGDAAVSVFVLVLVTDSRVAAELHLLCLRNGSVALTGECRLYNCYRATVRAAAVDSADLLRRKEVLRSHCNLDADLWSALELGVTPDLVEGVLSRKRAVDEKSGRFGTSGGTGGGRILTAREEHQQRVEAVLLYCESNLSYAGVLDVAEEASPLLIAVGLFFRLRLTLKDLYTHFVRHPRRAIRALALLIARYTVAPEELAPFCYPSLHDGVVIATSADGRVTCPMSDFTRDALTRDEVGEAWLPAYHPYFLETTVAASIARMEWLWQQQVEARQQRRTFGGGEEGEEEEDGVPRAKPDADDNDKNISGTSDTIRGSGRGIAAFGFKSLRELGAFAKQQERSLVPQRMTTLLAARFTRARARDHAFSMLEGDLGNNRHGDGGDGDNDNDDEDALDGSDLDGSNSDEEEFLINVDVKGEDGDADEEARALHRQRRERRREHRDEQQQQQQQQQQRQLTGDAASANISGSCSATAAGSVQRKRRREEERLDPHAAIVKEGYRVVLNLLGRRQPFDRSDERVLEF